jgi:hypothetical protein
MAQTRVYAHMNKSINKPKKQESEKEFTDSGPPPMLLVNSRSTWLPKLGRLSSHSLYY